MTFTSAYEHEEIVGDRDFSDIFDKPRPVFGKRRAPPPAKPHQIVFRPASNPLPVEIRSDIECKGDDQTIVYRVKFSDGSEHTVSHLTEAWQEIERQTRERDRAGLA